MVTALYRRYRPETFAEMIGQSQVTDPLMTALRTNRVNHAYLFSGPRGCGKTTSARILARCLNCAEGPTDTPCGVCPSCVELSRDGSGSLDVVEIDAASHNGVDDARDIRERAIFAPARDRYKIFILDEAHMVTPQGFNALLKIVEEPPEHVKFIFATTEPDKVIGTIRSRTHHYPFRLVPPAQMLEYVQQLCDSEKMQVAPGVLPLVVRAGGGSPRDTLSLLDQLMAGSDGASVEYERAVALLGYTHGALLDEAIDAIAARDSAAAFDAVDRVIQTGQDPRRFVEDLLERMRDLIIVAATSAEGAAAVLRGVPQDELDRMAVQATKFGPAELSRTADILNAALTEMTGATSPRLHLELMVARALIPASDDSTRGALARVERLERRIGVDGVAADAAPVVVGAGSAPSAAAPRIAPAVQSTPAAAPLTPAAAPVTPAASTAPATQQAAAEATPSPSSAAQVAVANTGTDSARSSAPPVPDDTAANGPVPETAPVSSPTPPVGPVTLQQVKDSWPQVLDIVKATKMNAWLVLFTARVRELRDGDILVLSFPSQKDVDSLKQAAAPGQGVGDYLKDAVFQVLGIRAKLIARTDAAHGDSAGSASAGGATRPGATAQTASGASDGGNAAGASSSGPADSSSGNPPTKGRGTNASAASAATHSASGTSPAASAVPAGTVTASGWTTVAIPGAGAAPAVVAAPAGETVVAEPVNVAATAAAPGARSDASESASSSGAAGVSTAIAPPVDEEPPPFDDDVPPETEPPFDPYESYAPPASAPAAAGSAQQSRQAPTQQSASATQNISQSQSQSQRQAKAPTQAKAPAFGEKQRYGESVVREILGATFLEEQPYNPAQRERGQ
ncbi:DNA polymerase III subunit gamma and tau [Leifsonia sp. A12D58]|uniref:DNA polymerase III subunit gamma and tau n=1 Tax=Leifsonia sp. A12D58 TaxID=3397674 RepID=UPI0039E0DC55